jgi:hypothetical protein
LTEQIKNLMELLDCTEEEALDILKTDEEIDKGAKHFELSADQKKAEKKMRNCSKAVNAYGKTVTRERKVDDDKRFLIQILEQALKSADVGNLTVDNPEREINFVRNDRKFKIVLSAPRK